MLISFEGTVGNQFDTDQVSMEDVPVLLLRHTACY
jgi:hypothetical protein